MIGSSEASLQRFFPECKLWDILLSKRYQIATRRTRKPYNQSYKEKRQTTLLINWSDCRQFSRFLAISFFHDRYWKGLGSNSPAPYMALISPVQAMPNSHTDARGSPTINPIRKALKLLKARQRIIRTLILLWQIHRECKPKTDQLHTLGKGQYTRTS